MEKTASVIQIVFAALAVLFLGFNLMRCALGGYDIFYTAMFAAMTVAGICFIRHSVAQYRASDGNHKQHKAN